MPIHSLSNKVLSPLPELEDLQKGLDALILECERLHEENQLLRTRQQSIEAEYAHLLEKNEQARRRVDAIIERLKALESAP